MSLGHGATIVKDGLVFLWDPNSPRCTQNNRTGILNAYSSTNAYIDAISGDTITPTSGMYLEGKTYYTLVGVQYPESSQSAPWTSRDGITPGISNTSAGKLYSCSRDLNYFVYDEDTNTWVSNSYFNGERVDGHCYDTYDGAPAQHATFQADFDNIVASFPNATHIVIGSHAAENNDNDSGTLARLQSIGLPDSHIGVGRPEYVLVGKVNRPSTWHYVRENVNSAIAVMNVGLPLEGVTTGTVFTTGNYLSLPSNVGYSSTFSQFAWFKSTGTPAGDYHIIFGGSEAEISIPTAGALRVGVTTPTRYVGNLGSGLTDGNWHYVGMTYNPSDSVIRGYIDGEPVGTIATGGGNPTASFTRTIGRFGTSGTYYANGVVSNATIYNTALTDQEVKQNFSALRGRYSI